MYDADGDGYDITSNTFWLNKDWVKDLNLSLKQKVYLDYYGYKKFTRALKIINAEKERVKKEFSKKYPDADVDKFDFKVELDRKTLKVRSTTIEFRASNKNFSNEFYWTPRRWGPRGTVSDITLASNSLRFNMTKVKIYLNDDLFFETTNFKLLDTKWRNKANAKDITKVLLDRDDPYFASLMAAYIISYKTGFSRKHLTSNSPDIITSIAKAGLF